MVLALDRAQNQRPTLYPNVETPVRLVRGRADIIPGFGRPATTLQA